MISFVQHLMQKGWVKRILFLQFPLAAGIFAVMALLPSERLPIQTASDHTLHFIGNLLLILSAFVALHQQIKPFRLFAYLAPYSLLIEFCQWFSPTRTLDIRDMMANLLGLLAGYALIKVSFFVLQSLQKSPKKNG